MSRKSKPYFGHLPKIYLKTPKSKKKLNFPWRLLSFFIFLGILGFLGYLLFFSPYFIIKNVEVKGTKNEQVINLADGVKGKNLWLFNKRQLEEDLAKFAEISQVKITRWPPKTIKIKITEKAEGIIWQTQGKKYLLDSQGVVVKEVTESNLPQVLDSKNAPIEIGKPVSAPIFVNFVKNLNLTFENKTGLPLLEIVIPGETAFEIWAKTEKIYLKLDSQGDLDVQLDYFLQVYSNKKDEIKEYVDLTTWDKGMVVYK